jgi:hypothetical protein
MDNKVIYEMVNELITMYPHLKEDKNTIISKFIEVKLDVTTELTNQIFDKITYEGKIYYMNKRGSLFDDHANVVGVYRQKEGATEYCLFEQVKELKDKLSNTKPIILE